MTFQVQTLLIHWGVMVLALWLTSSALKGMSFSGILSLLASALLLCVTNIIVRPALALMPLSVSWMMGVVLLIINALLIMLIASLVKGFNLSGIWAALLASLIIAVLGMLLELAFPGSNPSLFHIKQLIHIVR